jgi:hypothetical protein
MKYASTGSDEQDKQNERCLVKMEATNFGTKIQERHAEQVPRPMYIVKFHEGTGQGRVSGNFERLGDCSSQPLTRTTKRF